MTENMPLRESVNLEDVMREVKALREEVTLRDYFAAHSGVTWQDALEAATAQGMRTANGDQIVDMLVYMRFLVADAMLKARTGDE